MVQPSPDPCSRLYGVIASSSEMPKVRRLSNVVGSISIGVGTGGSRTGIGPPVPPPVPPPLSIAPPGTAFGGGVGSGVGVGARVVVASGEATDDGAVSYTHLTLPTIYSV